MKIGFIYPHQRRAGEQQERAARHQGAEVQIVRLQDGGGDGGEADGDVEKTRDQDELPKHGLSFAVHALPCHAGSSCGVGEPTIVFESFG